ncbi:MAG: L-lactate dehydrogenase [Planctomycetaceae bacterium]|nr:L-lactate dehydrogenase [Planctomycetaceae bacterium]
MKVGVVGSGFVGSTAAYALVMEGIGREIVLVDQNAIRARAEAADIQHAVPFAHPMQVSAGDYPDLKGSQVVIVAAGVSQKPGETRLQLLERNAAVFGSVIPAILTHASQAVLVIATNPVDVMTHVAAHYARGFGVPFTRVIGSGTTLDTARLRTLVGTHFGVDARHVHAHVVGEHGDSEVLTWSLATIGGITLDEFAKVSRREFDESVRHRIDHDVRRAAYTIIEGKGATYYGVGAALARIVDVIVHDQRSILTVCAAVDDFEGRGPVTLSLPSIVGGDGLLARLPLVLTAAEQAALDASAAVIRQAIESLQGRL